MNDSDFIEKFEKISLPFEDWTHEAHIRMAWCYLSKNKYELAREKIHKGIQAYNQNNLDKISIGYKKDLTDQWINHIQKSMRDTKPCSCFNNFFSDNKSLLK